MLSLTSLKHQHPSARSADSRRGNDHADDGPPNAGAYACTPRSVMLRILVVAALGLAGCQPAMRPPLEAPSAVGGPGSLSLRVRSAAGYPLRFEKLYAVLDGALLTTGPTPTLAPGDHYVQILVRYSMPCSGLSDRRAKVEIRSAHAFGVGGAPVSLVAEVILRGSVADDLRDRLTIRWFPRGDVDTGADGWSEPSVAVGDCGPELPDPFAP